MSLHRSLPRLALLAILMLGTVSIADAQLREDLARPGEYTGAIIKTDNSGSQTLNSLMESINMEMGHSYSMNFSSFGGRMQNLNAYTNHMSFGFSDKLTGNLDISLLHSPFGNSYMQAGNDLGARVIIDRAQLDYQISPNTSLSIQFSQRPYSYFGSPYGAYGPGYSGYMGGRNAYWY